MNKAKKHLTPSHDICVSAFDIRLICSEYAQNAEIRVFALDQQPICEVHEFETRFAFIDEIRVKGLYI